MKPDNDSPSTRDHPRPCNVCGGLERDPYQVETSLGLVRCRRCGLVFVESIPSPLELGSLYGERYFRNSDSGRVGYSDYLGDETRIRKTFARRLGELMRRLQPGRVLDIGCATGFFLDEARQLGWTPYGLDISTFAVRYAKGRFPFDVQGLSLEEADYGSGVFDLVTMWDVVEHVPDPAGALRRAAELLRRGGILALTTPDVESLPAKLTGSRWIGYKLSREHLYYFSNRTLNPLLGAAGLKTLQTRTVGKFVTVDFFLDRLGRYTPRVAKSLSRLARTFRLSDRTIYVDPMDILWAVAQKS